MGLIKRRKRNSKEQIGKFTLIMLALLITMMILLIAVSCYAVYTIKGLRKVKQEIKDKEKDIIDRYMEQVNTTFEEFPIIDMDDGPIFDSYEF